MNSSSARWQAPTYTVLSSSIVVGFWVFFAYSVAAGITKQSVYTGAIGFWLGAYLALAALAPIVCAALVVWMFFARNPGWKRCAAVFLFAWAISIASYWARHKHAQTQYEKTANSEVGPLA
jgi:fucose 4-O-acetylase-like acetyltransferase